jgi:hypothetical protein
MDMIGREKRAANKKKHLFKGVKLNKNPDQTLDELTKRKMTILNDIATYPLNSEVSEELNKVNE